MKHKDAPFYWDINYITNGHWLINKGLIKDIYALCSEHGKDKKDLSSLVPQSLPPKKYTKTNRLLDNDSFYVRVFVLLMNADFESACKDIISFAYRYYKLNKQKE